MNDHSHPSEKPRIMKIIKSAKIAYYYNLKKLLKKSKNLLKIQIIKIFKN